MTLGLPVAKYSTQCYFERCLIAQRVRTKVWPEYFASPLFLPILVGEQSVYFQTNAISTIILEASEGQLLFFTPLPCVVGHIELS